MKTLIVVGASAPIVKAIHLALAEYAVAVHAVDDVAAFVSNHRVDAALVRGADLGDEQAQELFRTLGRTPVIALTTSQDSAPSALTRLAGQHLVQPFTSGQLLKALAEVGFEVEFHSPPLRGATSSAVTSTTPDPAILTPALREEIARQVSQAVESLLPEAFPHLSARRADPRDPPFVRRKGPDSG